MRTRRLLLAASALSTLGFGCTNDKPVQKTGEGTTQPLPGNPKGTFYDDAMVVPPRPDPVAVDAAPRSSRDAARDDAGLPRDAPNDPGLPRDAPNDAGLPRDADVAPRDAAPADAALPRPRDAAVRPLPGNPKGSRYDAGNDIDR